MASALDTLTWYSIWPNQATNLRRWPHLFSEARSKTVTRCLLSALDSIHGRGIVHRHVKVENILLARDGRAVLADFCAGCAFWTFAHEVKVLECA